MNEKMGDYRWGIDGWWSQNDYIRWCFGEFVCKFKVFQGRGGLGLAGGLGGGPLVQSRVVLVVYKKQEQIYTTIMAWIVYRNQEQFIILNMNKIHA